jgi:hypothetical protein
MPFPYTFTFYSYKGGVGRSLALLNTAYVLSSWGRHVLIVDMDLEAPGVGGLLTRIGELSPQLENDLLDLLSQGRTNPTDALPPVSTFIRSVLPEKLAPLKPKLGESGRIDVLAPDMDRNFTDRLANLGIKDLNREEIINLGQTLHSYFKKQRFLHRPLGIEDFEDPIPTPYDYILIDSRTGLTEIGGLCVGPLADRLVVLSGLNDQNITGTKTFLNEVGIQPKRRSNEDVWDDADPTENRDEIPSLGPKPTIVVATPVPMGEIEFKRERLSVLQNAIGIKPLRVSYHPRLALMETIFVRDFTDEPPTADYTRLADRITSQVEDSADQLSRLASATPIKVSTSRLEDSSNQLSRLASEETAKSIDGPQTLRLLAQRPEMASFLHARTATDKNIHTHWQRRIIANIAESSADRAIHLNNWASACINEANGNTAGLSIKFLEAAVSRSAEAIRLNSDLAEAFVNWGVALANASNFKSGAEADRLLEKSLLKFAEATRRNPNSANAFGAWGSALGKIAASRPEPQADHLFNQSFEMFTEAVRLDPNLAYVFRDWGTSIFQHSRAKKGEAGNELLRNACLKFEEATRLDSKSSLSFSGWGATLTEQAMRSSPTDKEQLIRAAKEKLLLAGEIGLYNFACLEARQGNAMDALNHLKKFIASGKPVTAGQIEADSDFDAIRHDPNFADFVAELRRNTNPN